MIARQRLLAVSCLLSLALVLPQAAAAQCLTGWSNPSQSEFEYFGLNTAGQHSWVGQEFTTDCAGHFLRVEFMVKVDFFSFNGVAPLAAGEPLICTLLDDTNQVIASAQSVLGSGFNFQWVVFDFTAQQLGLAAGLLSVRIDAGVEAYGWAATDINRVPGRLMLGNDSDTFYSENRDTTFLVAWNPSAEVVATEEYSWGAVKALYR